MQSLIEGTQFLIREPADVYHAKASQYLSSHQLGDFRKCPQLYYQKKLGIVQDEDRPAYVVGRAVHTLALEGQARFHEEYAVSGPINPKTNAPFGTNTKAFADWAAAHGKQVLTESQLELVTCMAASVREHELADELLDEGIAEGVVRTEYCGVPCQIRMDWLQQWPDRRKLTVVQDFGPFFGFKSHPPTEPKEKLQFSQFRATATSKNINPKLLR